LHHSLCSSQGGRSCYLLNVRGTIFCGSGIEVGQTRDMLAHSSQERSGLCEPPIETKQIEKEFLQTALLRAKFLGTLRCGIEKCTQLRPYVRRNIAESGTLLSEVLS
jgi:hypothetical protein